MCSCFNFKVISSTSSWVQRGKYAYLFSKGLFAYIQSKGSGHRRSTTRSIYASSINFICTFVSECFVDFEIDNYLDPICVIDPDVRYSRMPDINNWLVDIQTVPHNWRCVMQDDISSEKLMVIWRISWGRSKIVQRQRKLNVILERWRHGSSFVSSSPDHLGVEQVWQNHHLHIEKKVYGRVKRTSEKLSPMPWARGSQLLGWVWTLAEGILPNLFFVRFFFFFSNPYWTLWC